MKILKSFLSIVFIVQITSIAFASNVVKKNTRQEYIDRWRVTALKNMFEHGIPASITLAQGILESGDGNSQLTQKANNHFGIKCHGWDGPGYYMDDDKKDECFRVYKYAEDSFEDHSQFLLKKRYANLFKLKQTDYKGWAKGLKKAGYATHPEYAKRLIKIIEDNKLYKYDRYTYSEYLDLKSKSKYDQSDENAVIVNSTPKKRSKSSSSNDSGELVYTMGRKIQTSTNKVNYIIAKDGDDYESIAKDMNLGRWQILKYNDIDKNHTIKEGEVIYIQPKRGKSKVKSYTAKSGDTWWSVSQKYGVKENKLLKRNGVVKGTDLKAGQKIVLR